MSFSQLGLQEELVRAVKTAGYRQPTSIQARAIPSILAGNDLIGTAQTGTGKTAAFVLPVLQRLAGKSGLFRALILTPTRELARQVEQSANIYGQYLNLSALAIFGGVSQGPQEKALRRGVDIVVATPGRLLDLASQKLIPWEHIEVLVLDEADRMMDMGFLPDLRKIVKCLPSRRQTLLFSATMAPEIRELAHSIQKEAVLIQEGQTLLPASSVEQDFFPVLAQQKSRLLLHLLEREEMNPLLVFTRTKHGADRLHRLLQRQAIKAARIHSGRTQNQRQQALEGFRQREYPILIATDIAARGIDVDDISHVINFDMPKTTDDYIHRIGRTGRAEKLGRAYTFISPEDESIVRELEKTLARKVRRVRLEDFDYASALPDAAEIKSSPASSPELRPSPSRRPKHGSNRPQAEPMQRHRHMGAKAAWPHTHSESNGLATRNAGFAHRMEGSLVAPPPEQERQLRQLQQRLYGPELAARRRQFRSSKY